MGVGRHRILLAGWFSFDLPHNTAGDLLAQQSARTWIENAGYDCVVAVANPKSNNEVAADSANPKDYHAIVFVCGPLTASHILPFIQRFSDIKRIALNVSIVQTSDLSKEFDVIIPRDTPEESRPDIALATATRPAPVVGLIYVGRQREYPTQQHEMVEKLVEKVLRKFDAATVMIDTKLPHNQYGLSSISQVESVIRHMDLIITTRLHGTVLSLRNGIPAIVIDSVPEGAKVSRQAAALGWPLCFRIGSITEAQLEHAIEKAMTAQSRRLTEKVINAAKETISDTESLFVKALA